MPTLAVEEAIRHLADVGYDSVEITVSEGWPSDVLLLGEADAERWRTLASDEGIAITSLTANTPVIVDDDVWPSARDRLVRSLELAAALQGPGERMPISLGASVPFDPSASAGLPQTASLWEEKRSLIVDRFGELARLAEGIGSRVALEPHVAAVVSRPERALWVLDQVGSDALGLNLDISHFAVQGMPTADVVRRLAPRAFVSEVKDQRGVEPDFDFLIPGEGEFDYVEFLREMAWAGYDGSVSVEVSVFRQRKPDYDPYVAASDSYRILSAAFDEAEINRPVRAGKEKAGK
ncbi:sugar phosphate isomerase/epimerase [Naasia sp. SYSU D00948]|uniref:sugar phosphate isomerase/epimerase family protein n=1 Tax=Naasia sp. SYSU D00948 TaxID=2817379 RepID=UPI001B312E53|nr:sugar phosphate isomerase/epimerase [Naasia sp. SYSU D00948]